MTPPPSSTKSSPNVKPTPRSLSPRVGSRCRFRNIATEDVSKSGVLHGCAVIQSDAATEPYAQVSHPSRGCPPPDRTTADRTRGPRPGFRSAFGFRAVAPDCSGKGVRLAQKMQVGPGIPVGAQLENAEAGPASGPTWRRSHLRSSGDKPACTHRIFSSMTFRPGRHRHSTRSLAAIP